MGGSSRDAMRLSEALQAWNPGRDKTFSDEESITEVVGSKYDPRSSALRQQEQRHKVQAAMCKVPKPEIPLSRETKFMYRAGRAADKIIQVRSGHRTRTRIKLVLFLWIFWAGKLGFGEPGHLETKWWELKEEEILPPFLEYWSTRGSCELCPSEGVHVSKRKGCRPARRPLYLRRLITFNVRLDRKVVADILHPVENLMRHMTIRVFDPSRKFPVDE